jgi:polysaccharide pyruvyl transferase WcaK-like protein
MERSVAVFARDPLSLAAVAEIAPRAHAYQAIDVAFALPFTQAPKGPGTRVGINVSGLLYGGGYTGANEFGLTVNYREFTNRLIEALLKMPGVTVELICHVNAPHMPADDDGAAADAVKEQHPAVVRVPNFTSPSAAKSHISGLDFLVGARMHATIAAYSSGVPVLPVSYSRKFEGLYKALAFPWLIPYNGLSTDQALALALEAFEKRDQLAADVRGAVERGVGDRRRQRVCIDAETALFEEVLGHLDGLALSATALHRDVSGLTRR